MLITANRFLDQDYAAIARQLQSETPTLENVVSVDDVGSFLSFNHAPASLWAPRETSAHALLCCFSTSGTTGFPKLAAHGHHSVARHARQVARGLGVGPGETATLCALPFYGVFGFMTLLAGLAVLAARPCRWRCTTPRRRRN